MRPISAVSVQPPLEAPSCSTDGAVFVDHTGTRRRVWAVLGAVASIAAAIYLALLIAAVVTSTGPGSAS